MTESKKAPANTIGAKKGKVRGAGQVTPKAADVEGKEVLDSAPPAAPPPTTDVEGKEVLDSAPPAAPPPTTDEYPDAFQAGYKASQHGTPSRPSLEYSDAEVKAWYRGYKAHANPQTGGPVDGIEGGYRGVY